MHLRAIIAGAGLAFAAAFIAHAHDYEYEAKPAAELLARDGHDVSYDDAIPLPEDVTGIRVGESIYSPDMLYAYMRAVADVSNRVTVDEIGRSHSGRPILRAIITAPANHDRLEDIRQAHLAFSEPGSRARVSDDTPVVIQYTHGVHGTEPSGYDSVPLLIYHLAAAQGEAVDDLLANAVIHIIAPLNPDGVARFSQWAGAYRGAVPVADPQHREHVADWPSGRVNKYFFDLNRQWLALSQPEIRAAAAATLEWMPNIAADFHEMGENTTYFFSPGPVDQLHPLLGTEGVALNRRMNRFLTEQLDSEGALYVSEEVFDDFYLGYGSSYPGLLGSVPYLFEQSSVRGILQETNRGVLRHDDKTGQQARVGLALIDAGVENRARLLNHQRDFYARSARMAADSAVRAYVFTSHDRSRLADFLDILAGHDIAVHELSQPARLEGREYRPGDSYIVPLDQRQHRVIQALFETQDTAEMTEFYDVSGWTMPLAYGLDYAEVRAGLFSPNFVGEPVEDFQRAQTAPEPADYAYVMEWSSFHAPRALYRLLHAGLNVTAIPDETSLRDAEGEQIEPGRGALVIPVANQPVDADAIHALVARAAEEDGARIHAVATGATLSGSDLGGFSLTALEKPEILLIVGPGVNQNDVGEIWHLLDYEMRMPVTLIDLAALPRAQIARYTHIILANGDYSSLGDSGAERLGGWVRDGGTLIGIRGGAGFAVEKGIASASMTRTRREGEEAEQPGEAEPLAYDEINVWDSEHRVAGAIFDTRVDLSHPLLYGYRSSSVPVHRIGEDAFIPGDSPFNQPMRYTSEPLMSGYASERAQEELAGKGAIFAERSGRGAVILFADNPYFRAYFKGSTRPFTNALFFSKAFRNATRRGE